MSCVKPREGIGFNEPTKVIEVMQRGKLQCTVLRTPLTYQTLATWLQKHRRSAPGHRLLPALIPAELDASVAERPVTVHPMEVILPSGVKLAIHAKSQTALAAALIAELQTSRPC